MLNSMPLWKTDSAAVVEIRYPGAYKYCAEFAEIFGGIQRNIPLGHWRKLVTTRDMPMAKIGRCWKKVPMRRTCHFLALAARPTR